MFFASIYGRLSSDPVPRATRAGKSMVTATLAVNVARPSDEPTTEWISVAAFGRTADVLSQHSKGDWLSISGRMSRQNFERRDGSQHTSSAVTAEQVVSARTVRPGRRAKQAGDLFRKPAAVAGGPPPPNDDVTDLFVDAATP
jgi:single stranded DNA-binding protein